MGGTDLTKFGGIDYNAWQNGAPFGLGTEMREFTCPRWWARNTGKKFSRHDECPIRYGNTFNSCPHFQDKASCWELWDIDNS